MSEIVDLLDAHLKAKAKKIYQYLAPPSNIDDIDRLEEKISSRLPESLIALYKKHNGELDENPGLFFGLHFMSTSQLLNAWTGWRDFAQEDPESFTSIGEHQKSHEDNVVKSMYANPKWIPFAFDHSGNHIGIDFDPGPNGVRGQIINFGRDQDEKYALCPSFDEFLAFVFDTYKKEQYTIGPDEYGNLTLHYRLSTLVGEYSLHFLDAVPLIFDSHNPEERKLLFAFFNAIRNRDFAQVKKCIQRGADVNSRNEVGVSALHLACNDDSPGLFRYLVQAGAVVEISDLPLSSVLDHSIIKTVLDTGGDINEHIQYSGRTLLSHAAWHADLKLVEYLIERGADVNAKNTNGETALMMLSRRKYKEHIIEALKNAGASA